MYRNDMMSNSWDDFYFTTKNSAYAGKGEQDAVSGFRSFNVRIDQPGVYYQRWHDSETLRVGAIKYYPTNHYTVITYSRPVPQSGTIAIGTSKSPTFTLASATTYSVGPGDDLTMGSSWTQGKTTEGVAFVDSILKTEGKQGEVAQLAGGLVNWAIIQSTFNVGHGSTPRRQGLLVQKFDRGALAWPPSRRWTAFSTTSLLTSARR